MWIRNCFNPDNNSGCLKIIKYKSEKGLIIGKNKDSVCRSCRNYKKDNHEDFIRICFKCSRKIKYKTVYGYKAAKKNKTLCNKCTFHKKIKKNFHSKETAKKISESLKGNIPWNKGLKGVQIPWNKGLTKEIDDRIPQPWLGKKRSAETIRKMLKTRKKFYEENPEALGKSKRIQISRSHRYLFEELKKIYSNVKIEYYHKGYFIDILVNDNVAIEVDGAHWHNTPEAIKHDKKRDNVVSKTYRVYRINPDNLIFDDTTRILKEIKQLNN